MCVLEILNSLSCEIEKQKVSCIKAALAAFKVDGATSWGIDFQLHLFTPEIICCTNSTNQYLLFFF